MHKLEMYYDYTCPFCLKGFELLKELISGFPDIEVVWSPCELSPRKGGSYSSLPLRGLYFARDKGADLWAYNDIMYETALKRNTDITNIDELAEAASGLLDADAFRAALKSGDYMEELNAGNDRAYDENGVWVLPAFRMDGKKLDSKLMMGVSRKQLEEFLGGAAK